MTADLEQDLREALHDDATHARLLNPDRPVATHVRSLPATPSPSLLPSRLFAAAAAALVLVAAGAVWFENDSASHIEVTTAPDRPPRSTVTSTSVTTTTEGGRRALPPTLARAERVEMSEDGFGTLDGTTLNLVAVEEGGGVQGEFRFDRLAVTIQCADTRGLLVGARRDLILGGEVTSNPDGLATLDGVRFAAGDRVALIIREGDGFGQRISLYGPTLWFDDRATAGSCEELAKSVPANMDGGMFDRLQDGSIIETARDDGRPLRRP